MYRCVVAIFCQFCYRPHRSIPSDRRWASPGCVCLLAYVQESTLTTPSGGWQIQCWGTESRDIFINRHLLLFAFGGLKNEETSQPREGTTGSHRTRHRGDYTTTQQAAVRRQRFLQPPRATFQRGLSQNFHRQCVSSAILWSLACFWWQETLTGSCFKMLDKCVDCGTGNWSV